MKRSVPAAIIIWSWVVPVHNGNVTSADKQLIARAERMFYLVQNNHLDIGVAGFEVKPGSFGYDESELDCPPGYLGTFRTGTCCKYSQKLSHSLFLLSYIQRYENIMLW